MPPTGSQLSEAAPKIRTQREGPGELEESPTKVRERHAKVLMSHLGTVHPLSVARKPQSLW